MHNKPTQIYGAPGPRRALCRATSHSPTTAQRSWNGPLMSHDDGASSLRCCTGMRNTRKITSHVKDFTDRGDVGEEDEGAMQRHKPQWAPFFRADMIDYLTGVLIRSQQHPINLWWDMEQYISPGPCPGGWPRLLMCVLLWKDEGRSIQPQGYRMRGSSLRHGVVPRLCDTGPEISS